MDAYVVTKYFGHFSQQWYVEAESEKEAWNTAEKNGKLMYQTAYEVPFETDGYVSKVENDDEDEPISEEEYNIWLAEAINMGMIVTQEEYAKALGLPFCDVWE